MELLDIHLEAKQKIFEYFNYEERWRDFAITDCREYFWKIGVYKQVFFHQDTSAFQTEQYAFDCEYSCEIYDETSIYRGKDYTMIICNLHSDGNIFLQVFSNDKEQ